MINTTELKLKLAGIAFLVIVVISLISLIIFRLFTSPDQSSTTNPAGTPTPVLLSPTSNDPRTHQFTSLQISTIGQTTDEQLAQQNIVLSKRKVVDTTIYEIRSKEPGKTDEIRTKDGVVIFEKTSTKTNVAPLPKLTTIKSRFGAPEEILDKVGEGFYMSAYLYPSQGFAVFANKYTDSVYEIQRFTPMTLADYKKLYGDNLSPAPQMPKEFEDVHNP